MNEKETKKTLKHTFWERKIKEKDGNIERKKIRLKKVAKKLYFHD